MNIDAFFQKVNQYCVLSEPSKQAWGKLLIQRQYLKGEKFISEGQTPKTVAFVLKGLFSQSYTTEDGTVVIKYFFPEQRFAASVSATLQKMPSLFSVTALEDTTVLEYDFAAFRCLVMQFSDIAAFYINYMEKHWIIEKEPEEIALRHATAMTRYEALVKKDPLLIQRLKQHHIAAYLGIAPESLSRMKK